MEDITKPRGKTKEKRKKRRHDSPGEIWDTIPNNRPYKTHTPPPPPSPPSSNRTDVYPPLPSPLPSTTFPHELSQSTPRQRADSRV